MKACRKASDAEQAKPVTTPRVTAVRPAGADHQVLTIESGKATYRRKPCSECPWRKDATGVFPAEAFRHSAKTAYDMAMETFACHQTGKTKPSVCAGFLLNGAYHNLAVRLGRMHGRFKDDVTDGGVELHMSYRAMAVANHVDPDDPILAPCRD